MALLVRKLLMIVGIFQIRADEVYALKSITVLCSNFNALCT